MAKAKKKKTSIDIEEYLEQLPPPPPEHLHELEMEKRVKQIIAQQESLTDSELRFYSRQIMLDEVGYEGQLKLKKSKVCIVGLGGLGSTIATELAAMGVGHLRLVDFDVVEESNLQRQHLYNFDVIGFPKVEAATMRLKKLNPYVHLEPLPIAFNIDNADEILNGMDVVIDGLDNMNTRYAVNRVCVKRQVPYVFGSAISTYGNASTIIPHDTACLECFYGRLDDDRLPTCGTLGVHPSVIGVIASIEVTEAVKILLEKQPNLKNKLLYCDVGLIRFEEIEVARVESCPVCGQKPKGSPTALKRPLIQEGCSRNNKRVFIMVPKENLNLKIKKLTRILEKSLAQIKIEAKLGVTFETKKGVIATILKSGIMIVEGTNSRKEAFDFYKNIIIDKVDIAPSRIS